MNNICKCTDLKISEKKSKEFTIKKVHVVVTMTTRQIKFGIENAASEKRSVFFRQNFVSKTNVLRKNGLMIKHTSKGFNQPYFHSIKVFDITSLAFMECED